jgi:hypothetical protein
MYYKNEDGIECFKDDEYGNLYVKNGRGRLFIVNRTRSFAKQKGLKVVYETEDGKIIIRPSEGQRRRINKKIKKAREEAEFMSMMKWRGIMRHLKEEDEQEQKQE